MKRYTWLVLAGVGLLVVYLWFKHQQSATAKTPTMPTSAPASSTPSLAQSILTLFGNLATPAKPAAAPAQGNTPDLGQSITNLYAV